MRKCICQIILIIILLNICIPIYAKNIEDLKEQSSELSNNLIDANNTLQVLEEDMTDNFLKLQELDNQLKEFQKELETINLGLTDLENKINENTLKLNKVKNEYKNLQKILDKRLVAMYKAPKLQNLNILLSSKSVSDFIGNYYAIIELTRLDNELLENVGKQKKEIETTENELKEQKKKIITDKLKVQKKSQMVDNTKVKRQYYIQKLTSEEIKLKNQIDEYNKQVRELDAEIKLCLINSVSPDYIGGPIKWPVPGYDLITSGYGMRVHPITSTYKLHTGIDIGAPIGTDFVAAANGVVVKSGYNHAYGNMIIIDHGGGVQTLYAHGSEILVQIGTQVKQGNPILKVGSTGYSTGPHAHFEIRVNGQTVNPVEYIVKEN